MEYIITKFLFGLGLGFVGLLLPNLRTIKMLDGKYIQVFFIHVLAAAMAIIFISLVAKNVIPFIIGNTLGGSIAVSYLSYKKHKQKQQLQGKDGQS